MTKAIDLRCIGESPPINGARKAFSYIKPNHVGQCALRYEWAGISCVVIFPNYSQARSAAIRAIFSPCDELQAVNITEVEAQDRHNPEFANSGEWLKSLLRIQNFSAECA